MVGLKEKVDGLDGSKHMGISSMDNFRCDPDLGIVKEVCRRIPCVCLICLKFLKTLRYLDLDVKETMLRVQ